MAEKFTKETAQGCLVLVVVAGLLVFGVRACFGGDEKPEAKLGADVKPEAMASAIPIPREERAADQRDARERAPASGECVLSIPGHEVPVPLAGTEEGDDAYVAAAERGASNVGLLGVLVRFGGFNVTKGTTCEIDDVGFSRSRVKVTSGPHAGKLGWVPNGWRRGAP